MLLKENKVQIEWMIGWGELGADGERWLSASLVELINGDQTVQVLQFAEPDYQHLILGDLEPFKLTVPIRNAKLSLVIDPDAPCIGWDVKLGRGGAAMTFRSKSDQAARFDIRIDGQQRLISTWPQARRELVSNRSQSEAKVQRLKAEREKLPSRISECESRANRAREIRDIAGEMNARNDLSEARKRLNEIPREIRAAEDRISDCDSRIELLEEVAPFRVLVVLSANQAVLHSFDVKPE
jgi:hypothetical protein